MRVLYDYKIYEYENKLYLMNIFTNFCFILEKVDQTRFLQVD